MTKISGDQTYLRECIEKVLISIGGHKHYHAQLLAGAVIEVLKEEGFITEEDDKEGDSTKSEKQL